MQQLELFNEPRRVSIRIVPQPIRNSWISGLGGWQWPYTRASHLCTSDPSTSEGMLRSSPYQVNDVYEEGWTISNVQVMYTQSRGWVWVIDLQDADENVLRDWRFLTTYKNPPSPEPRRMSCEHCFYSDEDDDVRVIPAQTAYHWVPGEENPNRPLLLCAVCAADYMSYWKERWDEYYAGLI